MEMLTSRLTCRNRLQTGATFQAVSPSRGRAQNLALLYVHPEAVPRTSPCCTSIPRPCPEPRLAVRPSRGRAQNLALLYVHHEAVPRTSPCCTSIPRLCPEPRLVSHQTVALMQPSQMAKRQNTKNQRHTCTEAGSSTSVKTRRTNAIHVQRQNHSPTLRYREPVLYIYRCRIIPSVKTRRTSVHMQDHSPMLVNQSYNNRHEHGSHYVGQVYGLLSQTT